MEVQGFTVLVMEDFVHKPWQVAKLFYRSKSFINILQNRAFSLYLIRYNKCNPKGERKILGEGQKMDALRTSIRTDIDGMTGYEKKLVKLWADKVGAEIWQLWVDRMNGVMLKGKKGGYDFSANLCLAVIKEFGNWTSADYAALTDYPEMAMAGDWSGVRDTQNIMPLYLKVLDDLIDAGTL